MQWWSTFQYNYFKYTLAKIHPVALSVLFTVTSQNYAMSIPQYINKLKHYIQLLNVLCVSLHLQQNIVRIYIKPNNQRYIFWNTRNQSANNNKLAASLFKKLNRCTTNDLCTSMQVYYQTPSRDYLISYSSGKRRRPSCRVISAQAAVESWLIDFRHKTKIPRRRRS